MAILVLLALYFIPSFAAFGRNHNSAGAGWGWGADASQRIRSDETRQTHVAVTGGIPIDPDDWRLCGAPRAWAPGCEGLTPSAAARRECGLSEFLARLNDYAIEVGSNVSDSIF